MLTFDQALSRVASLRLLGGHRALDFANTVDFARTKREADFLSDWTALVAWCVHAKIISDREGRSLGSPSTTAADNEWSATLQLRDAFRAMLDKWNSSGVWDAALLKILSEPLQVGTEWQLELQDDEVRFVPLSTSPSMLPRTLIAASIANILSSGPTLSIGKCEAEHCGWFYLDRRHGRRKRWCSMDGCGNRAKNERFHDRLNVPPPNGSAA